MKKVIFMLLISLGVVLNSCSSESSNNVEKTCCDSVCSLCDTTVCVVDTIKTDTVMVDSLAVDSTVVDTTSK